MTNLDERVRRELDHLANTVPASAHAATDFERKLARGRSGRRMPVLAVAAAAAAVVAAVAIPVAMNNSQPGGGTAGSTSPPTTTELAPTDEKTVELGRFTDKGVEQKAVLILYNNEGSYCAGSVPAADDQAPHHGMCGGVVEWPNSPQSYGPGGLGGGPFVEITPVQWGGQVPNLLFVAAPNVVTLEVSGVAVAQVAETETARYFFAKFPVTTEGYQYTAKDAAGNVVESGTT